MNEQNKAFKIIYIVSDVRSGSTLLDLLLSYHPQILSVGELHWLQAYYFFPEVNASKEFGICSCGMHTKNCKFWSKVNTDLIKNTQKCIGDFNSYIQTPSNKFSLLWMNICLIFSRILIKGSYKFNNNKQTVSDSFTILESIHNLTSTLYILESSKEVERARYYFKYLPAEIKYIFLVRDCRGVVLSKMNRNIPMIKAATSWLLYNLNQLIFQHSVPSENKVFLKYEDLIHKSEKEIKRLLKFLDLEDSSYKISDKPLENHTIGGSLYRFNKEMFQIHTYDNWVDKISTGKLWILNLIMLPLIWIFKYPLIPNKIKKTVD